VTRDHYSHLFDIYWPIGVGVGVVVWLATLLAVWRYRARRVGEDWPTGKDENMPVEIGYALLLVCVVAMLLYFTYSTMSGYERTGARPVGETVQVTAAKWNWRFAYPKYGIVSEGYGAGRVLPTLTVPANTTIRFRATSDDVIHAFWIPYERFQVQIFPGREMAWTMSFDTASIGRHRDWGECNQFCGTYHAYMHFNVDVLSPGDFRRWVQQHRTSGQGGPA
jgi:cytochrome c oxidase subunit 2